MTENGGLDYNRNLTTEIQRAQKKLVLHFDIRNTLIVADSVTSITVQQALNAYLTGVLWGREGTDDKWEWKSEVPSLSAPEPGTTTYYKHLERMIVRTPVDRTKLRLAVGDFVHTDMGASFEDYYHNHLEKLVWEHDVTDEKLTMGGNDGQYFHYILPAVFQLIQHLHDTGRDFSIIIRTYGLDCENVLDSLSHALQLKKHPSFPHLPDISTQKWSGQIIRQKQGQVSVQQLADGAVTKSLDNPDDIYKFMCDFNGVCGFRDDFEYWQNNNYTHKCAKPLWIDPNDTSHQHIIFDDNYRPHHEDSIVDVVERGRDGKWASLDNSQLHKYDNMSLVQVDLLEAISNQSYYIDKIHECESKFDDKIRKCREK